jgi:hypothetical protein
MMVVDFRTLKTEIEAVDAKIKELKTSVGSKEDIDVTVKKLLAKKTEYAKKIDGIGDIGKPFKATTSKSEKKKQAKAKKGGPPGGGAQAKPGSNKERNKMLIGVESSRNHGSMVTAPNAAKKDAAPVNTKSTFEIPPLQLVINPNAKSLMDRPMVASTLAILTNTDVNLNLTSNH